MVVLVVFYGSYYFVDIIVGFGVVVLMVVVVCLCFFGELCVIEFVGLVIEGEILEEVRFKVL